MWRKPYRLPTLLTAVAALLLGVHLWWARPTLDEVLPASIHEFTVELLFEGFGGEVRLGTYLPVGDERQTILSESFEQGPLAFSDEVGAAGRQAEWNGMPPEGQHRAVYTARISTRAVQYELPAGLGFGAPLGDAARRQLEETEAIPFRHREIRGLWNRIKPAQSADQVQVLRAIFDYTHDQIEPAPFKGYTDALTALRLGQASCNGKSRLFVALARLNGIPARLVGGVILEPGTKRTSHQWVEALLAGHWVPFDPLNGHFASLPADYLKLYRGDEFLFTHTRDINFDHAFRIRRLLAPADSLKPEEAAGPAWLGGMGRFIAANEQISSVFLLFPLVALIVTFCRNVVGLRTFGVFLPMLVAAGCVYTGLLPGMLGFVVILAIGAVAHRFFRGMRVLVIPRIAAVITVLTATDPGGRRAGDRECGPSPGAARLVPGRDPELRRRTPAGNDGTQPAARTGAHHRLDHAGDDAVLPGVRVGAVARPVLPVPGTAARGARAAARGRALDRHPRERVLPVPAPVPRRGHGRRGRAGPEFPQHPFHLAPERGALDDGRERQAGDQAAPRRGRRADAAHAALGRDRARARLPARRIECHAGISR